MMATNANTNATTTGMQLRNGKVIERYTNSVGTLQGVVELDGKDYMPLAHLKDFNWDWQQKVHSALSSTSDWTPESAYNFLQYLSSTSGHWCNVVWNDRTSDDGHDFGQFLMNLIAEFKDDALTALQYPNTRSSGEWKQEYYGWWKGTVRLASEIQMEWNVCEHMYQHAMASYAMPDDEWLQGQQTAENTIIDLTGDSEDEDMNARVAPGDGDADEEYDYEGQSGYGHV